MSDVALQIDKLKSLASGLGIIDDVEPSVLIVDDEIDNVMLLEAALSSEGYKTETAYSGAEAIELFRDHQHAIVLTDQRMPGMTGTQLLKRVATTNPETKRIVLTGYSDLEPIAEAINEGDVFEFMFKPWDATQICDVVQRALDQQWIERTLPKAVLSLVQKRLQLRRSLQMLESAQQSQTMNAKLHFVHSVTENLRNQLDEMEAHLRSLEQGNVVSAKTVALFETIQHALNDLCEINNGSQADAVRNQVELAPFIHKIIQMEAVEHHDARVVEFINKCEHKDLQFDQVSVRQGLLALLRNARRASQPSDTIKLTVFNEDEDLCFQIEDDGIGMTPEILERAMQPYFSSFEPNGPGLGLEVVRRVAENHDGDLELISELNQGTTARLWLSEACTG